MTKKSKLIIIGDSLFAEIAYEYFNSGDDYQVSAFSVESKFLSKKSLLGLPVVAFEDLERLFPPNQFSVFVAITYGKLNRLRTRLLHALKAKGYAPASYISPNAFVWRNVAIGEHCFIFENNVIQPFSKIGSNVILWSGNHIGHHCSIGDNCFISSQVVISGNSKIEKNSFLGVNSTIANDIVVGNDSWIGPGVTITKNIEANSIMTSSAPCKSPISSLRFFKAE